ncbi:MAG: hypothetical protein ACRDZY_12965, partial [Acidimicrobiales bacterium]
VLHYRSRYGLGPETPGLGTHPGPGQQARAQAFEEAATTLGRARDHIAARSPERLAELAARVRLAGLEEDPDLDYPHLGGPEPGRGPEMGM